MLQREAIIARSGRIGLALFYFGYFAAMGVLVPFFPLWLAERGLGTQAIGAVLAALSAAKLLAPFALRASVDARRIAPRRFLVAGALAAALTALAWPKAPNASALFLLVLLFGTFWSSILPVADFAAFAAHEREEADYARLRLWGSLGFIAGSLVAGAVPSLAMRLPWAVAACLLFVAGAAAIAPDARPVRPRARARMRPLLGVWTAAFLMQCSHGAYYGFFSLRLAEAGMAKAAIAGWWTLGVAAEIVLMAFWGARVQALATRRVFAASFALAALRWLGLAISVSPWALVPLQLLHAATFAAFHLAAVAAVQRLAGARAASAQAWHGAFGFGLGAAVGIALAGAIAERAGLAAAFAADALIALLGLLVLRMMRA